MFDFAEARLQVHGSNETENDDLENLHEKHEENDRKEKVSREILYRLGSILWKKNPRKDYGFSNTMVFEI